MSSNPLKVENGNVVNAFETMYLYCDEEFCSFGEKFNSFGKRDPKGLIRDYTALSGRSAMIPGLKEAPLHIEDKNFEDLELMVNIVDAMEQSHFDDGVGGLFRASLKDGVLTMELQDIPATSFRIYTPSDVSGIIVNGRETAFSVEGSCCII